MKNTELMKTGEKNEVSIKEDKSKQGLRMLALFLPTIAGVAIGTATIIGCFITPYYDRLIEGGAVSIITLAVTTWAGLNIANAIDRSEVNSIKETIDAYGQEVASMKENTDRLKTKVDDLDEQAEQNQVVSETLRDFVNESIKREKKEIAHDLYSCEDEFYQYLGDILEKDDSFPKEVNSDQLLEFGRLVRAIIQIRFLHEDSHDQSERIQKETRDYNSKAKRFIEDNKENEPYCNIVRFFCADAKFYGAFALYKEAKKDRAKYYKVYKLFSRASDEYIELKDGLLPNDSPEIVKLYFYNTIAQCFSEMLFVCGEVGEMCVDCLDHGEIRNKAEKYSRMACNQLALSRYPRAGERFFKNYGLVFDRDNRVCGNDDMTYLKNLEEAIKQYEIAFRFGGEQKNTYHVLCSAYNNHIQKTGGFKVTPNSNQVLWSKEITSTIQNEINDYADRLFQVSQIALTKWTTWEMMQCLFVLSLLYKGICQKQDRARLLSDAENAYKRVKLFSDELSALGKATGAAIKNIREDDSWKQDENA